jgi:transcriptional regulator with XRE-family HTH domain
MSYPKFGNMIRTEREKRDWDQLTLASAMKVKQQTISRWEAGRSRPSQDGVYNLAEIFNVDADEWLQAAGYDIERPVRPLTPTLPLNRLSPTQFELFSKDFISIITGVVAHLYGTQGSKQDGIDLYADTAEGRMSYQCKRHKQFGQEDVKNTVAANSFEATRHHLLLTRIATTGARNAISKYDNWILWDIVDISRTIQALPKDDALWIIDIYFPGHRKDFLDEAEPSPWQHPAQVYRPDTTSRLKLFSHGWGFVGRKKELQTLDDFSTTSEPKAIILSGIGGVGKSRLLRALSDRIAGRTKILFLLPGIEVKPSDFELLPKDGMIVIDDAHERSDLATLFTGIAQSHPDIRLVLSTRPYGLIRIQDDLSRTSISFDYEGTITLGDLSTEEAQKLAEEVIKEVNGDIKYARNIAKITKDCPLATVIGSRLVAEGKIKPELLNNSNEFRNHLLSRFRNIIMGEIGSSNRGAEDIRNLLDLIAMVQPVDDTSSSFQKVATEILEKRRWDKIARDIRALEDAGVLIRRSGHIRIVPDLLADFIRASASYIEKSQVPTGYADEVYKNVEEGLAVNLLVNLSQLDWRLSADGAQSQILDKVWGEMEARFIQAKIYGRETMLKALQRIAYYQPAHALAFAKLALAEQTDEIEEDQFRYGLSRFTPSYKNVVNEVAPLLKYVAYYPNHLSEVLNILRQLAKDDTRQTNQYPDHPMRILHDIAAVTPGKPLQYNEQVLEQAISWLKEDPEDETIAFEIFKTLLATEGHETVMQDISMVLKPYKVRAEAVAGIRKRIIDNAFEILQCKSLPQAIRAVNVLQKALSGPFSYGTMIVTPEDQAVWEPGFIDVLNRLSAVVADPNLNPFVALEIRGAVIWYATQGAPAVKQAAQNVLDNISTELDYELARGLTDGWGWSFERSDGWSGYRDKNINDWRQNVANMLLERYPDKHKVIEKLAKLTALAASLPLSENLDFGHFVATLIMSSTETGEALGGYILEHPTSSLAAAFNVIITVLSEEGSSKAISLAKAGAESGNDLLEACVSRALGWGLFDSSITDAEIAIIKALAKSKTIAVRASIPRTVKRFDTKDKGAALELLLSIDFTDSDQVADEVLSEFDEPHGAFRLEDLSPRQLKLILDNLVKINEIDKYHVGRFLARASYLHPKLTLQLLLDRVEEKERQDHSLDIEYRPVPYSWNHDLPFRFHETQEYEQLLRKVRDWASIDTKDWMRAHFGADVFKLVSAGYDAITLKVLEEWIMSSKQIHIEMAATLLSEAPATFVWDNSAYIAKILSQANRHSLKTYKRVTSSLLTSVIQGGRSGMVGQPFPEDIMQRDRAIEIMDKLSVGSPVYHFYKLLHDGAVTNIKRELSTEFNE